MKVNGADLEISNEESLISNTPKSTKYSRKKFICVSKKYTTQYKRLTITSEVDVRGLLVDEALSVVDKYLDDAYLSTRTSYYYSWKRYWSIATSCGKYAKI
ncbi:hypothetical protein AN639_04380 [Candidatus Epulonipiscium fishelsonii]|nr:hypothetical protein AN639_04380 [Epulopiscium sp. SCG-B05WGA-EpuloA1]